MNSDRSKSTGCVPWPDIGVFLALAAAAVKFGAGIGSVVDIGLTDETTFYLVPGLRILQGISPDLEYGPLYALWYAFWAILRPDPFQLYYLNYFWMTVLPTPLIYCALRRMRAHPAASALVSLWFLVSQFNLHTWPKVSAFALVLLLLFLALAPRRLDLNLAVAACGSLVGAYVRPEFMLSYGLAALALTAELAKRQAWRRRPEAKWLWLAVLLVPAILQATVGLPVSRGGRGWFAFKQHFALNWVVWNNSPLNPWYDYQTIADAAFGPVDGIAGAARSRPGLMVRHLGRNGVSGVVKTCRSIWPERWADAFVGRDGGLVAAAGAGLGLLAFATRRRWWGTRRWADCSAALVPLAVYSVPGALSALVFTPQDHYLLFPVVFSGMAFAVLLGNPDGSSGWKGGPRILVVCAAILLLVPGAASLSSPRQENARTIRFIRSLGLPGRVCLLEPESGMWVYIQNDAKGIPWTDIAGDVRAFVDETGVNAMLVDAVARDIVERRGGAEWRHLLERPESFGFGRMDVSGTDRQLLVRGRADPSEAIRGDDPNRSGDP